MTYYLEGPANIGSPIITLFDQPCGNNDDINCTLDDSGVNFVCNASAPAISGVVKPEELLSNFNGLNSFGTWYLRVVDPFNGDGGSINAVTLYFCDLEPSLSIQSNDLSSKVSVFPNPANNRLYVNLDQNLVNETHYKLYDLQGRLVISKKSATSESNINIENLVEGIYLLSIENGTDRTTKKIIIKR